MRRLGPLREYVAVGVQAAARATEDFMVVSNSMGTIALGLADQVTVSLESLQDDPFRSFARTHLGQAVPGKVTKVDSIGVFVRVHDHVVGCCQPRGCLSGRTTASLWLSVMCW